MSDCRVILKCLGRLCAVTGAALLVSGCQPAESDDRVSLVSTQEFHQACSAYSDDVGRWFVSAYAEEIGSREQVREAVLEVDLAGVLCPCMESEEKLRRGVEFQSVSTDYGKLFNFLGQNTFYGFGGPESATVALSRSEKQAFLGFAASHHTCAPRTLE